ncbi:MAG: alpha-galactosidase [Clostridia bacterium]|nr:alpha-galactosidase [Clostridia bacterium]
MFKITLLNQTLQLNFITPEGFESVFSVKNIDGGYKVFRTIKNVTENTLKLCGIKVALSGLSFGENILDDYFYSNENARRFGNLTIPLDFNRLDDNAEENKKFGLVMDRHLLDPEVEDGRICSSPYMPFPAVLISNYKSKEGVVVGSLSQDYFYHCFNASHQNGKILVEIFSEFKGVSYREVKPNEVLTDSFYIGQTTNADNINKIFNEYTAVLLSILKDNRGASDINRHSVIWDSWNDGIYRNVSEGMLIEEAKAIKKYFPTVEWFQLDDGYSSYCHENVDCDAHGIGVVFEGEDGIDKKKFPAGLKGYTDKIKEIGLKPAIWIGGFCPVNTKIYKERSEWFIDYRYRVDSTQPLDVSKEEVRDYMSFALDKFICEYGFEGVKHDFWSYAFEDGHDLLSSKDRSGSEYRTWWLNEFTKRLPDYGYLETGCDLSMGNPFIGKYVNNYRFGLDVGAGEWEKLKTTVLLAVAVLGTHTGDLFIPNSDSIGMLPNLSDTDFMFIVNFQIITRTLVELSGRFSKVDENSSRLKVLQRALKYINNGEDVFFLNYDYRKKGKVIPEIIYINSAFDADDDNFVTVGVFNIEEKVKEIEFSCKDLGLTDCEHQTEYVWEEKMEKVKDFKLTLQPHQSVLLKIKKK